MALLTPGPISDQSWNGGAYEGLIRIRDSLDARISHIQTKTPAEFNENFRQYGAQSDNLVFSHGFEFQDADAAGQGVFQAAKESKGVRVIGSNSNKNNVAPDVTIGSEVIDLPRAFLAVAREVKTGKFTPRVISFGLHDNIVRLVLNPRLEPTIPTRVRAQIDSARIALNGGTTKQQETK